MIHGIVAGRVAEVTDAQAIYNSLLGWWDMEDNVSSGGSPNEQRLVDSHAGNSLALHASGSDTTAAHGVASGKIGRSMLVHNSTTNKFNICFENPNEGSTLLDFGGDVSFTVGGWFKSSASTNPDFGQRYFGRIPGTSPASGWGVYRPSGTTTLQALIYTDGTTSVVTTAISITATNWNFVVFRYDAATDTLSCRVNSTTNTASQSGGVYTGADSSHTADFTIGRHQLRSSHSTDTTGLTADFEVDAVFACNQALTDAQIDMIYNAGTGINYATLAAAAGH